ncbi:MAG: RluA family pseudouridine synthase [bacterium]|nr:RluA family pseudouridine synthase [bacterium]
MEVLFENNDFLVINKPSGLIVHPDGKSALPTLVDWILAERPDLRGVGEPLELSDGRVIERPGIVHRLDKETSGALILAKNQPAFAHIKEQFSGHSVRKLYHAFAHGSIKNDEGIINRPIGRSRKDFRRRSAERGARGKIREAVTLFRVFSRIKDFTFVEAEPRTGRTHQIRVHFRAINHPIVCDSLYAPKRGPALGFKRLALHARTIQFKDLQGKDVVVTAPYPDDFEQARALFS